MTIVLLAILALLWIAVCVPDVLRARRRTPLWSTRSFKRGMAMVAPRAGRWVVVPRADKPRGPRLTKGAHKMRRVLLLLLLGAAGVSGVVAVLVRGQAIEVHLVIDAALAFYVALLMELKRRRDEKAAKVRPLVPNQAREQLFTYEPLEAGGRGR